MGSGLSRMFWKQGLPEPLSLATVPPPPLSVRLPPLLLFSH